MKIEIMKRKKYITLIIILVIISINIFMIFLNGLKNDNEVINSLLPNQQNKYKGISTTIEKNTTKADIETNLDKMQNINASIALCVMEYINEPTDNTVKSIPDWKLKINTFMNIANKKNIKIQMLKPHIGTYDKGDSFSRVDFNPKNKEIFFKNWEMTLLRYAEYCNKYNIPILAIECEMSQLTNETYYNNWQQIVNTIRLKYPKLKLTTAFTYSDLQREIASKKQGLSSILDLTDYIGFNLYPVFSRQKAIFPKENADIINEACNLWNKKMLITETGATSWSNTSSNIIQSVYIPENRNIHYDFVDQYTVLNVVLNYTLNNKNIAGVFLWHTNDPFNFLDSDTNYDLVKKYYGSKL